MLWLADNTKWRAGRAGGPCCQMKKLNFLRADELHRRACCTAGRASGLHIRRAGGLHSKLVCGKGRAGGLLFSAVCPALFGSLPDRLLVQPAGPPFCLLWNPHFCLLCIPPKLHVFHVETGPSARTARLSVFCAARRKFTFFIWKHGPPARLARRPTN